MKAQLGELVPEVAMGFQMLHVDNMNWAGALSLCKFSDEGLRFMVGLVPRLMRESREHHGTWRHKERSCSLAL